MINEWHGPLPATVAGKDVRLQIDLRMWLEKDASSAGKHKWCGHISFDASQPLQSFSGLENLAKIIRDKATSSVQSGNGSDQ